LDRLEEEHDNLGAALGWTRDSGDVETGLRVASGLIHYWHARGRWAEGQRWLQELLTGEGHATTVGARISAIYLASFLSWNLGDAVQARVLAVQATRLAQEAGDRRDLADSDWWMAWLSRAWGDYPRAQSLAEEGLSLYRELGDRHRIANMLQVLGDIARDRGDSAAAEAYCRESLATYRELGDSFWMAFSLHNLGRAAQIAGDYVRAGDLCRESLTLLRQLGDSGSVAEVLNSLGLIARARSDNEEAARLFSEGLTVLRSGPTLPLRTVQLLEGLAGVAALRREGERAARLFGAADAVRTWMGVSVMPVDRIVYDRGVEVARSAVGEQRFTAAWNDGRTMSLEEAMAYALGEGAEAQ
jgi:tetratricopeptide (TPR) repeat protein